MKAKKDKGGKNFTAYFYHFYDVNMDFADTWIINNLL